MNFVSPENGLLHCSTILSKLNYLMKKSHIVILLSKQCMVFLLVSHDDLAEIHVILPCFPEVTLSLHSYRFPLWPNLVKKLPNNIFS